MKKGNLSLHFKKKEKKETKEKKGNHNGKMLWGKIKHLAAELKTEIKKADKNGKREKKIANSLMLVFAAAILLMVLLGSISYSMAAGAVKQKYEDAVISAASSMSTSLELICESVSGKAVEFYLSEDFNTYYNDKCVAGGVEATRYANDLNDRMIAIRSAAPYIGGYYLFADKGKSIVSNVKGLPEGVYSSFMATEEGAVLESKKTSNSWKGTHSFLDEQLGTSEDAYVFSYMLHFKLKKNQGFLVMDIDKNYMEQLLGVMELGNGSIRGIVTEDGREILLREKTGREDSTMSLYQGEPLFVSKEFYEASDTKEIVSDYVRADGKKQLFVSAPVGKTGMKICVLVPERTILKEVSGIRNVTVFLVIVASLFAMICGFGLSRGISRALKSMSLSLQNISKGNLMEQVKVDRRDEFGRLADGMNEMLGGIRGLVGDNQKFGSKVTALSEQAYSSAVEIENSMKQVEASMTSVSEDVREQSRQTELSVNEMSDFSERINDVYHASEEMTREIEETLASVKRGKVDIDKLSVQSVETAEIAESLLSGIDQVNIQSGRIVDIIKTIENIASQTNLLSLNASIEAARAGESGRGFSVVASEIRKLAEQSMQAGTMVREIVNAIQESNKTATDAARTTEDFLRGQTQMLKGTVDTFGDINQSVATLVEVLQSIQEKMENMQGNKEAVNTSIEAIYRLSGQIAEAVEGVSGMVKEKRRETDVLGDTVRRLNKEAEELQQSMSMFVLEEQED